MSASFRIYLLRTIISIFKRRLSTKSSATMVTQRLSAIHLQFALAEAQNARASVAYHGRTVSELQDPAAARS
jgi:hypothetical protein